MSLNVAGGIWCDGIGGDLGSVMGDGLWVSRLLGVREFHGRFGGWFEHVLEGGKLIWIVAG